MLCFSCNCLKGHLDGLSETFPIYPTPPIFILLGKSFLPLSCAIIGHIQSSPGPNWIGLGGLITNPPRHATSTTGTGNGSEQVAEP